jgi:two-component system C4-dicarboxylate transport response regulator DctD
MPTDIESKINVLVIEDQPGFSESLELVLRLANFDVQCFVNAELALEWLSNHLPDVVLTDLQLPGMDGVEVISRVGAIAPELPVVLMTAYGNVSKAVQAMQNGAYDFIEKPFSNDRLLVILKRASEQYRLKIENRSLRNTLSSSSGMNGILCGESAVMQRLRSTILRVAPTSADVLISGETGTGKEIVARLMHTFGAKTGNFVAVNCGAIPETLFESELFGHEAGAFTNAQKLRVGKIEHAHNGTLFLDEINCMPLTLQAKLLRVIQEREIERIGSNKSIPVNIRVVAATNVDIESLVTQGKFRADLFYRLDVVAIKLPALRERREDILLLFKKFLETASMRFGSTPEEFGLDVRERLLTYNWPGNVRELKNAAERQALGLPLFTEDQADNGNKGSGSLKGSLHAIERMLLESALQESNCDLQTVCGKLDITLSSLYRKLSAHRIDLESYRAK